MAKKAWKRAVTRADLALAAYRHAPVSRHNAAEAVDLVLATITEALVGGEIVLISGFGVFQVRSKKTRMGRNPKTGVAYPISERRTIVFKASRTLKAKLTARHLEREHPPTQTSESADDAS
ncbi:integration host factor subunit alpha [Roseiarcaceae bacterium H3SJ34-1]|uniref:integration host factor subunit alpha n=1 Tax=Terripilifer ovatus TaxID=3032367 RepID=UPI003AB9A2F0|nr:integration host factor subunit alpha [Roseiarcaceae bacterium H3SJ34-1]